MRYHAVAAIALMLSFLALPLTAQVPAGGEFQVNTYTTWSQTNASVASDAAGNFVVTWESSDQDNYTAGVFAQRYDASGAPRGSEFRVNTYTTQSQDSPSVASDAAGNFVVVWESGDQDGSSLGVFGQRFDASGQKRGGQFQVNTYSTGLQRYPTVTSDAAGNFVVAWDSEGQDGSSRGIFGQRYDASGVPQGFEFQINTYTTSLQACPAVSSDAAGNFVVAWYSNGQDGSSLSVFAQRYDASGQKRGGEFEVNTYTTTVEVTPAVSSDAAGNFVVVWEGTYQDGSGRAILGQRYDASGVPQGSEFQVNTYTTLDQWFSTVTSDSAGNFVVVWESDGQDGSGWSVFAQRYDATGGRLGSEFQVNTHTTINQMRPAVAADSAGNFVVAWQSYNQDGSGWGVFAQRYGGLQPVALDVDSSGNGVLEPNEAAQVEPSWKNVNGTLQSFDGIASGFGGPAASGVSYQLTDPSASYGSVADGATAQCSDCYEVQLTSSGTRPAQHWDATLLERITGLMGQTRIWALHVGESFADVPTTSPYYRFVETLLHKGVTGGCSATDYCPGNPTTRDQMAIFALVGKEGSTYSPPACGTPMFGDVPASSPYCRWVEELANRGVVGGCGGGNYCPSNPVTRGQMAIFMLKTLDPALDPPACGTPLFGDLPASSPYCRWVEELANRGVVGGCGGGNYCPNNPVTRGQMGVFISATFGLTLYGP